MNCARYTHPPAHPARASIGSARGRADEPDELRGEDVHRARAAHPPRKVGENVKVEAPRLNPRTQKLKEGKSHMVGKECSQFTLYMNVSTETTRRICDEVLAADYTCFGYDSAKCGQKSDFVPPPPVHFGELRKWENQHSWVKGMPR